ncbi:threonine-phosphate decarboxylase [Parabacteroides sp. PFB2-10]|uniref:threonine-phosphate decarboxylase n=1 Tax=Parabacteroides sp. PFB2-10 TaxID=1742405 RepID=UPI0024768D81|nr:pyridoxal phosphate-dependent class II aminotransferase [Parabacteroides sp. PFB2-10]MDH6313723.1 threonine-phosphate decarboxylase [Parabacteroides sp. PFB2-10]
MIQGHGDDIHNYAGKIVANFSSNIRGAQDMPALCAYLAAHLHLIHSYPEPEAESLRAMLAGKLGIEEACCCVTNGATEAIYLIAKAFEGSKTAILIPTFSEYEDACRIHRHTLSFYEQPEEINLSSMDLVWICNPNNPTGKVYNIDLLKDMVERNPQTCFVFDQSYGHFTRERVWDVPKATSYRNLILLHSMTKQYAIPGLRLGYLTAHRDLIANINLCRMPWSVNVLAVEAGKFLLENEEMQPESVCLEEAKRLQQALQDIEGLTIYPTDTHFFLCRLKDRKAAALKEYLIESHGILIRDAANFRGLDPFCFRIAAQLKEENNLLVKAIRQWI